MATRKKAKTGRVSATNLNIVDSTHHIWLAGLGALSRAQREGPKVFQTLVAEGTKVQNRTGKAAQQTIKNAMESLQSAVGDRVTEVSAKAQETWDNLEKIFQQRVQKAIHQLGIPSAREIKTLTSKVEELSRMVENLKHAKTSSRSAANAQPRSRHSAAASAVAANGPAT